MGERSDQLVVVAAGTSWDGVPYPERHVAAHLARRAHVLWVDPPISVVSPLRRSSSWRDLVGPHVRSVAPGILRLTPLAPPGMTRSGVREIVRRTTRSAVRRAVRQSGLPVQAVIVAALVDLLDVVPAGRRMFYGTDDFVAGAELMGVSRNWLEGSEHRLLSQADVVVAISEVLQQHWRSDGIEPVLIPNGCDAAAFAACDEADWPDDVALDGPIAGFVGQMSDRIDLDYLEAVANRGISVLLVGPRQPTFDTARLDSLLSRPTVQWVGPKPFTALPSYLRTMEVGLTPYRDSTFNRASFPLKTLEYLAAGRRAVSTDLPVNDWLSTDLIAVGTTPEQFAAQVQGALATPRSRTEIDQRRAFAANHSWQRRSDEIADLLGLSARIDASRGETQP